MKIESIYHSKDERKKDNKNDRTQKQSSKDPIHHPFLLEREYIRALNATKLERMFAKPFIAALSHHKEGINKLCKSYTSTLFASSSYDNKTIVWDLTTRDIVFEQNFKEIINGIALNDNMLYVSQGKSIIGCNIGNSNSEMLEFNMPSNILSIDSLNDNLVAGGSRKLSVFDINRITPKLTYDLNEVIHVKFNRSFEYLMGARTNLSINIFDNRSGKESVKIETEEPLCMSFNPQKGYMFAVGKEDGNAYLHDLRNPDTPIETYRGHTNSIVSISFNPNGKEIVTGSFDKTIRLFNTNERKPRDCYYNDRMHLVHGAEFSNDGNFVISGSDDSSLRIWKAYAGKKVGPISRAEKVSTEYTTALKEKFRNVGEVSRISKHRFLNSEIKHEMRIKHEMYEGKLRRAAKREKEREFKEKMAEELPEFD